MSKRKSTPAAFFIALTLSNPNQPEPVDRLERERYHRALGRSAVCGIDEVGRGPLAGPVVAACVILSHDFDCRGIDDSKKLTERQREGAYARLTTDERVRWSVGIVDSEQIDRENILRASHSAMRLALGVIECRIDVVLVDGLPVRGLSRHIQEAIIGGDGRSASIGAASIIAKVTRDRLMVEYDALYPEYGFAGHKGYAAARHLDALRRHGPCPIHRRSFAPVRAALEGRPVQCALL